MGIGNVRVTKQAQQPLARPFAGRRVHDGLDCRAGRLLGQGRQDDTGTDERDGNVGNMVAGREWADRYRQRSVATAGHVERGASVSACAVAVVDQQLIAQAIGHDNVNLAVTVDVTGGDACGSGK